MEVKTQGRDKELVNVLACRSLFGIHEVGRESRIRTETTVAMTKWTLEEAHSSGERSELEEGLHEAPR